jgi:Bacterial archaeo-eukaryotic release factor family 10
MQPTRRADKQVARDLKKEINMYSPQQLDEETIRLLSSELPTDQVLSVICVVNPASSLNQGGAMRIRIKNLLTELELPDGLSESVLADLTEAGHTTRTRAYFVWDDHGHLQRRVVDVQLELPESVQYGAPNLEPLHALLASSPRNLIVLVDHDWGRMFSVRLGEIRELHDILGLNAGRREAARNFDDNQYVEHQDQVFWNKVVEQLTHLRQSGALEQLLIAGPPELRESLKAELTADLTGALVGEFKVPGDASAAHVLEAAQMALETATGNANEAALANVRERGVSGAEMTLTAVQEGSVYEILVSGDGSSTPVWRDAQGYVFGVYPNQGISTLTGGAVEGKQLRDVIGGLRENFGLRVRFLQGEMGRQLETEMGGLAGLQRHPDRA